LQDLSLQRGFRLVHFPNLPEATLKRMGAYVKVLFSGGGIAKMAVFV